MRVSVAFPVPVGRVFEAVGSDCVVFTVGNAGGTPVSPCVGAVGCCEGVCGCCVPAGRVCLGVTGSCVVAGFGSPVGAPEGLGAAGCGFAVGKPCAGFTVSLFGGVGSFGLGGNGGGLGKPLLFSDIFPLMFNKPCVVLSAGWLEAVLAWR